MSDLVLTDGSSVLTIALNQMDPDAYVAVSADSKGFSGMVDLHVLKEEFAQFCQNLIKLSEDLSGQAKLSSVSPDELEIVIKPYDNLGHISVKGSLGNTIYTRQGMNWHAIEFGFEIDSIGLERSISGSWVKHHAA